MTGRRPLETRRLVVVDPPYRVVGDSSSGGSVGGGSVGGEPAGGDAGPGPGGAPPVGHTGRQPPPRRWKLPLVLFVATCASTLFVGFLMHASSEALDACLGATAGPGGCAAYVGSDDFRADLALGGLYAGALLLILMAHEMGHFLQALRYRVPTSLPYFIPLPLPPFGTMGALLAMRPRTARHKGLFDVAVSGPLAGLVPTLIVTYLGLQRSEIVPIDPDGGGGGLSFAVPPLFSWLSRLAIEVPPDHTILMHPLAYAGWVGLFITALNLLPIGQLDGGHILYTLAPRHAHRISIMLIAAWVVVVIWRGYWQWTLMILLLVFLGLRHPPLARGSSQLGWGRRLLGVGVLALVPLSFSIEPIRVLDPIEGPVESPIETLPDEQPIDEQPSIDSEQLIAAHRP